MKVIIIFYTQEIKPPEIYYLNNIGDHETYLQRIVDLTKSKAKFCVNLVGDCVGDFS